MLNLKNKMKMKNLNRLLIVSLFMANFGFAYSSNNQEVTFFCNKQIRQELLQSDSTTILFTKTSHDYGTIKKGSDGNCVFTFKNTGNKPLILKKVKASCGCTTPSWPRKPVAPGESGEIKVHYDTNRIGYFQKTITITSNAKIVILTIKGTVKK